MSAKKKTATNSPMGTKSNSWLILWRYSGYMGGVTVLSQETRRP
jgi:hypothetical protein